MSTTVAAGSAWLRVVNVGQDRQAGSLLDLAEDTQTFIEPGPAKGRDRGAIGLVERRLEDDRHADAARRSRQSRAAISTAWPSLSITHGPRMNASGWPVPKETAPAGTGVTFCMLSKPSTLSAAYASLLLTRTAA